MKRLQKIILFLLFGLSSVMQANAQVKISASIDTVMLLIGDQTTLRLSATYPEGMAVQMPILTDTIIRQLEVIEASTFDTTTVNGQVIINQAYVVTSFDSGYYQIPQFPLAITMPDGSFDTIYSNNLYFGVMTMPIDTTQPNAIADIRALEEAPVTFKEVLPWLLYSLLGILIVALVYLLVRKLGGKESIFMVKEAPKEPAHVIALRDLDTLKEQKLWQRGLTKEYYSSLVDILRVYLDNRFNIQAMESTSEEILRAVGPCSEITREQKDELKQLLYRADFVKFAKASALANENEDSYCFVEGFVVSTKLVEQLHEDADNKQNKE
ncbi:MAG: hypothetical protein MJ069_00095 [Salinivirgaceae bacterium]|nr:hypothetical protein [Salinivirgaceae bacterium]